MKRIVAVILCLVFALMAYPALAANISYKVESAGITIALPQEMYVFTRDVLPTDERITALGLTYEGLMSAFDAQDMYLEAMDTEKFNEIIVIAEDTKDANFYDLGYDGLYNAAIAEEKALEDSGRKVINSDLYENNNVDFIKTISKATDCQVQYTTVYNNKKIKIKLLDFDGTVTEQESEYFEGIVDTVAFINEPVVANKDTTQSPAKEPEAVESNAEVKSDASAKSMADAGVDKLGRLLIIIAVAIAVCTIPALLFRFVFAGGGMSKGGAGVFAVFYSVVMAVLFYYALAKYPQLGISTLICIVPLVWGLAIYKIVKR